MKMGTKCTKVFMLNDMCNGLNINDTISRNNWSTFNETNLTKCQAISRNQTLPVKHIVDAWRDVEIAFRRAMPTEEIFEHDHLPRSILFDSRLPTKSETSQLVNLKIVHWQHFGTKLKPVIPKSV